MIGNMAEKLTPETEECYKRVPASFPEDWFDWSGPGDQGLKLKKEAPARAHRELKEYDDYCEAKRKQGIIVN